MLKVMNPQTEQLKENISGKEHSAAMEDFEHHEGAQQTRANLMDSLKKTKAPTPSGGLRTRTRRKAQRKVQYAAWRPKTTSARTGRPSGLTSDSRR